MTTSDCTFSNEKNECVFTWFLFSSCAVLLFFTFIFAHSSPSEHHWRSPSSLALETERQRSITKKIALMNNNGSFTAVNSGYYTLLRGFHDCCGPLPIAVGPKSTMSRFYKIARRTDVRVGSGNFCSNRGRDPTLRFSVQFRSFIHEFRDNCVFLRTQAKP